MAFTIDETLGAGGLTTFVLAGADARVEVVPERGGLVTRFRVADDDLLFLDESTLLDRTRPVRGGIPVLFPFAGRLPDDRYAHGTMKQHGFARNRAFGVLSSEAGATSATLECRLTDDAESRPNYPWAFELRLLFTLLPGRLRIEAAITNRDARPMPHALGYHPYFRVLAAHKADVEVETDATEALDNTRGVVGPYGRPDFSRGEVDLHLRDHTYPGTLLRRLPLRPVRLDWDDAFERVVLWTLPERPFVCVEPWVAAAGAMATGEGVRIVAPGETDRIVIEVST